MAPHGESHLLRRAPCARLAPFVALLWSSARPALAHPREWGLPSGCADLVIPLSHERLLRYAGLQDERGDALSGGVLQGACEAPFLRHTGSLSEVVGVHFRPGGLAGFFGESASAFSGRHLAIDAVWPGFADGLRGRLDGVRAPVARLAMLEALLLRRLRAAAPDPLVAGALQRIALGEQRVGALARFAGCTPERFGERFREVVGLGPKRFLALRRLRAALDGASGQHWAEVALAAGYADQAHLSRDFRRFTGMTPTEYRRGATEHPLHVAAR